MLALKPIEAFRIVESFGQHVQELALSDAQIVAAAGLLAAPEGDHGRGAFGRENVNAIDVDAVDAPGAGAEEKDVADAALVDKFLIDFAEPQAFAGDDGVLAGVRDRAAGDEGQALAAGQRLEAMVHAIP